MGAVCPLMPRTMVVRLSPSQRSGRAPDRRLNLVERGSRGFVWFALLCFALLGQIGFFKAPKSCVHTQIGICSQTPWSLLPSLGAPVQRPKHDLPALFVLKPVQYGGNYGRREGAPHQRPACGGGGVGGACELKQPVTAARAACSRRPRRLEVPPPARGRFPARARCLLSERAESPLLAHKSSLGCARDGASSLEGAGV